MMEFVVLISRTGDRIDRSLLEPLSQPHPRGSHFRAAEATIRSAQNGRRLTLVRASQPGFYLTGEGEAWAALDGIAICPTSAGASMEVAGPLARALRPEAKVGDIEQLAADMRGNFLICASLFDGSLVVATDSLGTYPFFLASTPLLNVLSNNALLLEAALSTTPHPAQRSATGMGIEAVFGSGALGSTGYENVQLVPGGRLALVTPAGELSTQETAASKTRYQSCHDRASLIDRAVQQVTENVRALAAAPLTTRVADLTGGADSRLVLAAILAEGVEREVGFFCSGSHPGPDYSVSAYLQDIYGLQEARGWLPPAMLSFDTDPVLTTRHLLYRTMGCYAHYFLSGAGNPRDPDLLRLHGGLGETFRSFYSGGFSGNNPAEAATYLLETRRWRIRRQYFTAEFADRWEKAVHASLIDRCATGVPAADALDQWYIENRNRYHFGVTWRARLLQHASFHPLYSPAAVAAAYTMPAAERAANRVGFEMMRRLYEPLTLLPFAEKRWSRSLTDGLPDAELYRQLQPFTPKSPIVEILPGRRPTARPTPHPPTETSEREVAISPSAWARKQLSLGQPHWWVPFDVVLPAARDYVSSLATSSPMWDVFARARSTQLLNRPLGPAWTGREIQIVYKLLGAGIWLSRDEAPSAAGEPI